MLLPLLCLGCGADNAVDGGGLQVEYELLKRGASVACTDANEVREIEVTLFAANGITPRAGWPRKSTCTGTFTAEDVEAGEYVLQVAALGVLQGDSAAVLYKARTNLTLPHEAVSLSLEPEVAFLDLGWTFGSEMLAPCAEVASIDVIVAAGAGDPYNGRFSCQDTPVQIQQPFSLQSYAIQVAASSAEGFPLFTATAQRTLDRGLNEHTAVLTPLGSRVFIDFDFQVAAGTTRLCDDPGVHATDVRATIRNLEGGAPVTETFACMEERPYAFRSARFTQGRQLELELLAEADARFKGIQRFTMPADDHSTGILTLVPVGSATVSVEVQSSTCTATVDRYAVRVRRDGVTTPLLETTIEPPDDHLPLVDLPYGAYRITVDEIAGGSSRCTTEDVRTIERRDNAWDPFVL